MRRTEALHPAAFLIDEDRHFGAASACLQVLNQRGHLARRFNVPFEQDETPWPLGGDEGTFVVAQNGTSDTGNEGLGHIGPISPLRIKGSRRAVSSSRPNTGHRRPDSCG